MLRRSWPLIVACSLAAAVAVQADEAARPTLRLRNGGYVAGELLTSDNAAELTWQGDGFARPLRFPLAAVHSVQYPVARADGKDKPAAKERYCFELAGGDLLVGDLVSLSEREAVLEIPALGKVTLDRSSLLRFYPVGAADLSYSGPNGLDGWTSVGEKDGWRDEGGALRSDVPRAIIGRHDRPPALVRYELELSWTDKPDFEFSAGLSKHLAERTAFRLETWGEELVITREADSQAEVAILQKISKGAGTLALSVLFDESKGRVLAYSAAGEQLADFTVPPDKNPVKVRSNPRNVPLDTKPKEETPTGLLLTNRGGTLKLQRLVIRRWSGIAAPAATVGLASIVRSEGKTESGEVRSFDAQARQLIIFANGKEARIDEKLLQDVVLRQRDEAPARSVRVLLVNGNRLSGEIEQLKRDGVVLRSPSAKEPFILSVQELRAVAMTSGDSGNESAAAAKLPRLELPGVSLRGNLQPARQGDDACLVFQPAGSTVASPLAANVAGKLIFREVAPIQPTPPTPAGEESVVGQIVSGINSLFGNDVQPTPLKPKPPGECLLHLRSGDIIPCRVEFIDERGVTFESKLTEASFVPHASIKVLELRPDARPVKIEKTRFDRLLTLPRMQRDNPPEQLIRSLEGDYLRGRLVAMNDKQLDLEMRLDAKKVARDQVSRILWLHPDERANATVAKPAEPPEKKLPTGIRVQAVPANGNRLTFFAQELADKTLSGQSELLGACRVEIDKIDQLLIGSEIEKAAASLAFHQWRLRPAAEPLPEPEAGADPGSGEGMESSLVGKPAPAIELDLLTGGKFRLADCKDKVVILDFWASWCGPCLQAMPQIEKVAKEFSEEGVQLVAINLEETPDAVKNALAKLKLEMKVALDTEGRTAERYGATAIPQTVIIGRDGKVARLFVGGGSRFDERLRQALRAVLKNETPKN